MRWEDKAKVFTNYRMLMDDLVNEVYLKYGAPVPGSPKHPYLEAIDDKAEAWHNYQYNQYFNE